MSGPYGDAAQAYWRAGWANPIPVKGKDAPVPGYTGYEGRNVSWPDIQAWLEGDEAGHNIALRLPGDIIGIDVDAYDGKVGDISLTAAEAELGPLPESARSTSRPPFAPSGIRLYRVPLNANLRGAEKRFAKRFGDHIDIIRRDHRYAMTWPSVHPHTGWTYRWYSPDGGECEIPRPADLPELPTPWLEFLAVPTAAEPPTETQTGSEPRPESLWDQFAVRQFTREQAREFVRPHLEALRAAPNGTINNRLNDAAIALAHFIPTFIPRAEAARYLLGALEETVYDGKTWKAETTIASAFAAKTWRAEIVDETAVAADGRAEALQRELDRLRLQRDARRIVEAEDRPPVIHPEVMTLRERLARPLPATTYRIEGWQPAGSRVVLAAQFKAGKTTMTGNLARSLVDGDSWLGSARVTPIEAQLVILDFEMSPAQMDQWLGDQAIRNDDRIVPIPLRGNALAFDILDRGRRAEWAAELRRLQCQYLMLDCLRPVLDAIGLDEHHDAGRFLVAFDALLAEAGVTEAAVVHHMGHTGERSRGDSRIRDWPDVEWRLVRQTEDPSSPRYVSAFGRDVDQHESQLAYEEANRHLSLIGGNRRDMASRAALNAIVVLVDEQPRLSGNQIEDALGDSEHAQKSIREALKLGLREGVLIFENGPRNARLYLSSSARRTSLPVRQRGGGEFVSSSIDDELTTANSDPRSSSPQLADEDDRKEWYR